MPCHKNYHAPPSATSHRHPMRSEAVASRRITKDVTSRRNHHRRATIWPTTTQSSTSSAASSADDDIIIVAIRRRHHPTQSPSSCHHLADVDASIIVSLLSCARLQPRERDCHRRPTIWPTTMTASWNLFSRAHAFGNERETAIIISLLPAATINAAGLPIQATSSRQRCCWSALPCNQQPPSTLLVRQHFCSRQYDTATSHLQG